MDRRQFVTGIATAVIGSAAGCTGGNLTGSGDASSPTQTPTDSPTEAATASPTDSPSPTSTQTDTATATEKSTATERTTDTGSSGKDSDGDGVPDSKDDFPQNEELSSLVKKEELETTLETGQHAKFSVTMDKPGLIGYHVALFEGQSIDSFLVTKSEFQKYKSGGEFQTISEFTVDSEKGGKKSNDVEKGNYVAVFDNTNKGPTEPEGTVEIDAEIIAAY